MTRMIYKFNVPVNDEVTIINMPPGGQFVHCDLTPGYIPGRPSTIKGDIWLEFYEENQHLEVERAFRVYGTGQPIPDKAMHVGTFKADMFVWHVYEVYELDGTNGTQA